MAAVLGSAGATASAQPVVPQPPTPNPSIVAQTPAAAGQQGLTPATSVAAAAPGGISTPPVAGPPVATITPASSGTLAEFFAEKGVKLEPQASHDFKALNIVLPVPKGWSQVPDPNVPDAFAVIADRVGGNGLYSSNAQLVVYKLVGDFDPREAISHGFVDSQKLPAWRATDGSLAEFGGMPSSVIEGTYRENSMTLNASRRHVIATVGPDRYLVTLSVITSVDQVVAAADATDAIVRGFRVSVPGATPATAIPTAAAAAATSPPVSPPSQSAISPTPQLLGLPG